MLLKSAALALALAPTTDAFSFLKEKRISKSGMVTITSQQASPGIEYSGPNAACCGCMKARALAKTDGAPKQCGTCYVADTWQTAGQDRSTAMVGQTGGGGGGAGGEPMMWEGICCTTHYKREEGTDCAALAKEKEPEQGTIVAATEWGGRLWCTVGLANEGKDSAKLIPYVEGTAVPWWFKSYFGGLSVTNLIDGSVSDYPAYDDLLPGQVGISASAAPASGGYEVITSKQESIHQWHWTCADGNAPTSSADWAAPAVEGEPPSRDLYMMCAEPEMYSTEDVLNACDAELEEGANMDETTQVPLPYTYSPWKHV